MLIRNNATHTESGTGITEETFEKATSESIRDQSEEYKRKLFKCEHPECEKTFTSKAGLTRHCKYHSSMKTIKCQQEGCWKFFKRKDALQVHMRLHLGETPYVCSEKGCEKKFSNKAGLRYHVLKHKNEKTYTCKYEGCNKRFLTLSQLHQHEKSRLHSLKDAQTKGSQPEDSEIKILFDTFNSESSYFIQ